MIEKIEIFKVEKVDDKSYAYGKPTKSSDLDLLIVVDNDII